MVETELMNEPDEHSDGAENADPSMVGDGEVRDQLPADLDPRQVAEPYLFPNNSRHRIPAVLYALLGAGCLLVWWIAGSEAVLVNTGVAVAGVVLLVIGAYHWQGGWDLSFDEERALAAAAEAVGFPVGHASAQLGWRGLRSRPTWKILLYSNEASPKQRGLVLVDGINGEIIDQFVESNPEDWSAYPA